MHNSPLVARGRQSDCFTPTSTGKTLVGVGRTGLGSVGHGEGWVLVGRGPLIF